MDRFQGLWLIRKDECEGVAGIKTGPHLINECVQLQAWFRSKIETGETGLNGWLDYHCPVNARASF